MKRVVAILALMAALFGRAAANDAQPLDSVGVALKNGSYFIIHEVLPRQTLYAVSKIYKVTTQDLLEANPGMIPALKGGQLMLVPLKNFVPQPGIQLSYIDENGKLQREGETAKTEPGEEVIVQPKKEEKKQDTIAESKPEPQKEEEKKEEPRKEEIKPQPKAEDRFDWKKHDDKEDLYHTVQPGETLYKIATYYGLSVQEIMDLNRMENSVIAEGKSLLIKKAAKKREQKEELPGKEETTQEPPSEATTNEIAETGMGLVIDKNFPDANKNIALHVSAQVGTIVKITNPANNREVYVRVVGQLKTDAKGVIIMISPEAANQLGASLTEKVKLTLSYTR